jgi:hypothetical protein
MPDPGRSTLARAHRIVIGAAIALALLFALYSFTRGATAIALASTAVAIALALYLRWFTRKSSLQTP